MITLAAANTLQGGAGSGSAISYTLTGLEISGSTETFKVLAQSQLAASPGVIYTVPGSTSALVKELLLSNVTGAPVTATFYVNGVASSNKIVSLTLPANGSATFDQSGWKVYDSAGQQQFTGTIGPTGATGRAAGIRYGYLTSIANTDPGSGNLKFDSATLSAAVSLRISETDGDGGILGPYIATWDDSTSTIKGYLKIRRVSTPGTFAVFAITGSVTDNGTWDTLTVAHVASSGSFVDTDEVRIEFIRNGDQGIQGIQGPTGDVASSRTISTTAPLTGGGDLSTNRTLAISAATSAAAGSMSAADKSKFDNFNLRRFNVKDYGALGNNSQDDTTFIQAAIDAAEAAGGGIIYFPAGVYNISATLTMQGHGLTLQGHSVGGTLLYPIPAWTTGDVIQMASGWEWNEIKDMQVFCPAQRTTGCVINTNGAHDVIIQRMAIGGGGPFIGVGVYGSSIKVTIKDTIITACKPTDGVAIDVNNGLAGDTYVGPYVVISNGAFPLAGVRVIESGHFSILGANVTSCNHGLLVIPAAAKDVSYGFISHTLFDSGGSAGMTLDATSTGRIRSLTAVNAWFSGNNAGPGVRTLGSAGQINDVAIGFSRFLNNSTHGIQHGFGTNFRVNNCTIAGNSVAGSGVNDGINVAAGVSDFYITSNKIGTAGTAPTPSHRYGVAVAAGASNRYKIVDNDLNGNIGVVNTNPCVNDLGTGTNKDVFGNIPGPQSAGGLISTNVTLGGVATEQVIAAVTIPANSLSVGTVIRCVAMGTATQTAAITTSTIRGRLGIVGSGIAAASIAATAQRASPAAIRTTTPVVYELIIEILSLGTGGTALGGAEVRGNFYDGGAVNVVAGTTVAVAIDTTIDRDIVFTHQASVATMSAISLRGSIEIVRP